MSPNRTVLDWRIAKTGELLLWISTHPDKTYHDNTGNDIRHKDHTSRDGAAGVDRGRCVAVPGEVLHGVSQVDGLTRDPASDLIRAESGWRLRTRSLEDSCTRWERAAVTAFADLRALPATRALLTGRDRAARARLRRAVHELAATVGDLSVARRRVRALREFVIGLDVLDGLLGEARAGWQRAPARPVFVSTYADEQVFVTANPRRSIAYPSSLFGWPGPIAGEAFGVAWRRDRDDDNPYTHEPAVIGPWHLGYIPGTGEIFASRRCLYRDPQVWLLARGHTDPQRTRRLLRDLQPRMNEPNSLLHAAHIVHTTSPGSVPKMSPVVGESGGGEATCHGSPGWPYPPLHPP
jgi:hypothetical protein